MPTDRLPLARPIRGALTIDQVQELWLGPSHSFGSLFPDEEAVQAAWERHRDWLMQEFGSHGKRPMAWYFFERPDVPFDVDHESSILWRAGVFTEAEKAEVETWWKTEFERARGYDTSRRRRHLDWADVPSELRRRWARQHRRHARTAKELAGEASDSAPPAAPALPST
jgi:hypothetical protein